MILSICPNPSIDTYAYLESFELGKVNRINKLLEHPGGKGTHVALAINELGGKTKLLGNWAGTTGDWIQENCKKYGLKTGGVTISGANRKCLTFRGENEYLQNTELLEPGPEFMNDDFNRFLLSISHEIEINEQVDLICASGSWPLNAPKSAYASLIELANKNNVPIIVDCAGDQLHNILDKSFFGIHVNEQEALSLFGTTDLETVLGELSKRIELVAITKGKDGLWLSYQGEVIHANVEIKNIISTVGSGDCLTAGIAHAVSLGKSAVEIARMAVAFPSNYFKDAIGAGDSFNAGFVQKFLSNATLQDCLKYANIIGSHSTTQAGGTSAFDDLHLIPIKEKEFLNKI